MPSQILGAMCALGGGDRRGGGENDRGQMSHQSSGEGSELKVS